MNNIDLKMYCCNKVFAWRPPGYTILGILHKGHYYVLFSFKR